MNVNDIQNEHTDGVEVYCVYKHINIYIYISMKGANNSANNNTGVPWVQHHRVNVYFNIMSKDEWIQIILLLRNWSERDY